MTSANRLRCLSASTFLLFVSCDQSAVHSSTTDHAPIVKTVLPTTALVSSDTRTISKSGGTFSVYTTTFLCFGQPEFSDPAVYTPNTNRFFSQKTRLLTLFPDIAPGRTSYAEMRQLAEEPAACFKNPRNIWIGGRIERSRFGDGHRVTMVARQGNAWWQGSFERSKSTKITQLGNDGFRSSSDKSTDPNELIAADLNSLGRAFYMHLAKTSKFI